MKINPRPAGPKPNSVITLTYNGQEHSNGFIYGEHIIKLDGSIDKATDIGFYESRYQPEENYCWDDGTRVICSLFLDIQVLVLSIPYISNPKEFYFNNEEQSINIVGFNSTYEQQTGVTSSTAAGDFTITWSLKSPGNTKWSDDTTELKTDSWRIIETNIGDKPSTPSPVIYDKLSHSNGWTMPQHVSLVEGSVTSGTNAGSYTATYRPDNNYCWSDGDTGDYSITLVILQRVAVLNWGQLSFVYDGNPHSTTCTISNLCSGDACNVVLANNSLTDVGQVSVTATGLSGVSSANYALPTDGSTTQTLTITKQQAVVNTAPVANASTYTGLAQDLVTAGVASTSMLYSTDNKNWSGNIPQATNAGSYTVYYKAAGNANYTESAVGQVSIVINKIAGTLTLSASSISIKKRGSGTITASGYYGTITASSGNTGIATTSVSGATCTISGVGAGSTLITITASGDVNHNSKSATVTTSIYIPEISDIIGTMETYRSRYTPYKNYDGYWTIQSYSPDGWTERDCVPTVYAIDLTDYTQLSAMVFSPSYDAHTGGATRAGIAIFGSQYPSTTPSGIV